MQKNTSKIVETWRRKKGGCSREG